MVIDGVIATRYAGIGVAMLVAEDQDQLASGLAAMAVVPAASAVYGWRESARCSRAFADHEQFLEFDTLMRQPMGAPGAEVATPL